MITFPVVQPCHSSSIKYQFRFIAFKKKLFYLQAYIVRSGLTILVNFINWIIHTWFSTRNKSLTTFVSTGSGSVFPIHICKCHLNKKVSTQKKCINYWLINTQHDNKSHLGLRQYGHWTICLRNWTGRENVVDPIYNPHAKNSCRTMGLTFHFPIPTCERMV